MKKCDKKVIFDFDTEEEAEEFMEDIKTKFDKRVNELISQGFTLECDNSDSVSLQLTSLAVVVYRNGRSEKWY